MGQKSKCALLFSRSGTLSSSSTMLRCFFPRAICITPYSCSTRRCLRVCGASGPSTSHPTRRLHTHTYTHAAKQTKWLTVQCDLLRHWLIWLNIYFIFICVRARSLDVVPSMYSSNPENAYPPPVGTVATICKLTVSHLKRSTPAANGQCDGGSESGYFVFLLSGLWWENGKINKTEKEEETQKNNKSTGGYCRIRICLSRITYQKGKQACKTIYWRHLSKPNENYKMRDLSYWMSSTRSRTHS